MQILLIILVAMLIGFVVLKQLSGNFENSTTKVERGEPELPYVKKPYLMTNAEREFFFVLERAVQGRYYIVPQVELSKIVQVQKGMWQYRYKNRINLKSVDFVLFDKQYFTPQIVIELDDSSHKLPNRVTRDSFLDSVMKKVGIKVVHVKTSATYNLEGII